MKILSYILVLGLSGCIVDASTDDDYVEVAVPVEEPERPQWPAANTGPKDVGCPSSVIEMPDGSVLLLPGLCNPLDIYQGYPDPTQPQKIQMLYEQEIMEEEL